MIRTGTIGFLEKMAGIEDRAAFWTPFAKIDGYEERDGRMISLGFEAGVKELQRLASERVIDDYPAYAIVADKDREYRDGEKIAVPYQSRNHGKLYSFYQLGSVEAHARKNGDDVEAAIAREKSISGKLYFAFGLGTSLTAWERTKEVVPGFEIGEVIQFEGKRFKIERAPNNNIELIEIKEGR